jgi:ferritin
MPELSKKLTKEFNKQIQEEVYSAYLYYNIAAWFYEENLPGFGHWLTIQALEELTHAHKFYRHIVDRLGHVELLPIDAPPNKWDAPVNAFTDAYNHEVHITERIHMLVKLARDEGDYAADTGILQWFVNEQIEEEQQTDDVVRKLKLIGDNKAALYMLDREMQARVFVMPPGLIL